MCNRLGPEDVFGRFNISLRQQGGHGALGIRMRTESEDQHGKSQYRHRKATEGVSAAFLWKTKASTIILQAFLINLMTMYLF